MKGLKMMKPNFLLEDDVREELDWDPALDDSQILLKAHDGFVTLSGTVDTYAELLRATEDTWKVGGVTGVDNELLVGLVGEAIADAELTANCMASLDGDRFVPHGAVSATVVDGFVTLRGRVRNHIQRLAAEHAVGRVFGVLGVTNEISISSDPVPSDVADRINKAFARKAILSSSAINVSNEGDTIYLDGTTDSYAAMREAVDTAWEAPGVSDVVNHVAVVA
jgi:osmotically-inducible protein OsmY